MRRAYRLAAPMLSVVIAALGTGGGLAAPASSGHGYWTMFMDGPAHNGDNRDETTLSPSTVGGLRNSHSYTNWVGFLGEEGVYPVVMGNIGASLIDGDGNKVRLSVFNLPSGSLRWSHLVFRGDPLPASPVPVINNGDVFVAMGQTVYAYNALTGHLLWSRTVSAPRASFNETTVSNGIVYAATYDSPTSIYALNATTGALLWSSMLAGESYSLSAVSVVNGVAFVSGSHLWAFNATSGAHLFTTSSGVPDLIGTPAVSGGKVYVQTAHTVEAFSASTGGHLWSGTTAPSSMASSWDLAVDGSTVVAVTPQYVIAFDASSGARLWKHNAGSEIGQFPPAIADGVVYVGAFTDGLQAFREATGAVLYSHAGDCFGSPIVSQGAVYVACRTGVVNVMQVFSL
jgi:outer membrane protein assembly factor BamB